MQTKRKHTGLIRMKTILAIMLLCIMMMLPGCSNGPDRSANIPAGEKSVSSVENDTGDAQAPAPSAQTESQEQGMLPGIPAYQGNGEAYTEVNGNVPYFTAEEMTEKSFEKYAELDDLGRCGVAYACIGQDLMPTEERGDIGRVKPSGWQIAKYDFVDGKYLYNRCHLIGFQLTGENANEQNLITGTRYMNVDGMLPFENMVADYIHETGNHVMYRVTPLFNGDDLVARGVLMEAKSVEDGGQGILFNVFAYNVQPGVEIDYATGENHIQQQEDENDNEKSQIFIVNNHTGKFHLSDCPSVEDIREGNRGTFSGTREEAVNQGLSPCGRCHP